MRVRSAAMTEQAHRSLILSPPPCQMTTGGAMRGTDRRRRPFSNKGSGNWETPMSDEKTKRAPQDTKLISITEDYEVEYWTERFGVTRERLAAAVRQVGRSAQAVERYFDGM